MFPRPESESNALSMGHMMGGVERGMIKDNPAFPSTLHYRNTFPNRTRTRKVCSKIQYHFLKGLLVGYDVTHISPSLSALKTATGLSSERSAAARRVGCICTTFAIPQPVIFTTWRKREGKRYCPVLAQVMVFRYKENPQGFPSLLVFQTRQL